MKDSSQVVHSIIDAIHRIRARQLEYFDTEPDIIIYVGSMQYHMILEALPGIEGAMDFFTTHKDTISGYPIVRVRRDDYLHIVNDAKREP